MASSVSSPADIINLALARIGRKDRIGSLYDGSMPAKIALTLYAQTRDELLIDGNWEFAERNVTGVLLKQGPVGGYVPPVTWNNTYPPLPWIYEYSYPSDALKIRAIKPVPIFFMNPDPSFNRYSIDNDNGYSPPEKVILTNVANAVIVYTGQITDPTTYEADFVEALAAALGRRLAPALMGMDFTKLAAADEGIEKQIAENTQE